MARTIEQAQAKLDPKIRKQLDRLADAAVKNREGR